MKMDARDIYVRAIALGYGVVAIACFAAPQTATGIREQSASATATNVDVAALCRQLRIASPAPASILPAPRGIVMPAGGMASNPAPRRVALRGAAGISSSAALPVVFLRRDTNVVWHFRDAATIADHIQATNVCPIPDPVRVRNREVLVPLSASSGMGLKRVSMEPMQAPGLMRIMCFQGNPTSDGCLESFKIDAAVARAGKGEYAAGGPQALRLVVDAPAPGGAIADVPRLAYRGTNSPASAGAVQLAFAAPGSEKTMADVPLLTYRGTNITTSAGIGLKRRELGAAQTAGAVYALSFRESNAFAGGIGQVGIDANAARAVVTSANGGGGSAPAGAVQLAFAVPGSEKTMADIPLLTYRGTNSPTPSRVALGFHSSDDSRDFRLLTLTMPIGDKDAATNWGRPIPLSMDSGIPSNPVGSFRLRGPEGGSVPCANVYLVRFIFAEPPALSPCAMRPAAAFMPNYDFVDQLLVMNLFEEARQGGVNKRSPEIRKQFVRYIRTYPFTQEAYEAFEYILNNAAGNTLNRRMANLEAWACGYEGGRYAPILSYYIAYHLYRVNNHDAAAARIAACKEQFKEYHDRLAMLEAMCAIRKNNLPQALTILEKVQEEYPDSSVVPEAVFLKAWVKAQDNELAEARTILQDLAKKYPASASAGKARQLLTELAEKK